MYEDNTSSVLAGVVVTIMIVFLIAFLGSFRYDTTRAGEHSGYVTAIEQSGLIFHNYNVYFKTDNSSSQEDLYCVQESNKELADKLKTANKERKQVTIRYEGVRGFGFNLCANTRIESVE